jgi:predicted aconitase with swiveling domain
MTSGRIRGTPLVPGNAEGYAVVTDEPLSFWGGVDSDTGQIIDRRHPLACEAIVGSILVLPFGRRSCSSSGVLLESI